MSLSLKALAQTFMLIREELIQMETGPEHPLVNDLDVASGRIESYFWSTKIVPRMEPLVSPPVGQSRFNIAKSTQKPTSHDRRTEQRCTASTDHVSRGPPCVLSVVIEAA